MRIVENWRQAWKWLSVQALAVIAAVPFVWPMIPPEVQAWLPPEWRPYVIVALAIGGIAGRLIPQKSAEVPPA